MTINWMAGFDVFHFDVFYIIAAFIIAGSVWMVLEEDLFRSCMALAVTMILVGVLYFTLDAGFIAAVHLLIYAGAVTMLYLFMIMLTRTPTKTKSFMSQVVYRTSENKASILFGLLLFFVMSLIIFKSRTLIPGALPASTSLNVADIGKTIFTDYLLPFELVSVLLTLTMIGAVVIARGDR